MADFPAGRRGMVAVVRELQRQGERFVLCLVVLTEGSTYRKAGALAVVSATGKRSGALSGGCLDPGLEGAALRVLEVGAPEMLVLNTHSDDDLVFGSGSGCRGRMSILLVPAAAGRPSPILAALTLADERRLPLRLAMATEGPLLAHGWGWCGGAEFALGSAPDELLALRVGANGKHRLPLGSLETMCAVITVRADPSVLLIGVGPETPTLIRIGHSMGWTITLIDHRPAAVDAYAREADARIVARPAAGLAQLGGQAFDAVVVMTHTAANDLAALATLGARSEGYVGLLGPSARRDELIMQLDPSARAALAARLQAPVGLHLGGHGPEILALSIAAGLQQHFAGQP